MGFTVATRINGAPSLELHGKSLISNRSVFAHCFNGSTACFIDQQFLTTFVKSRFDRAARTCCFRDFLNFVFPHRHFQNVSILAASSNDFTFMTHNNHFLQLSSFHGVGRGLLKPCKSCLICDCRVSWISGSPILTTTFFGLAAMTRCSK